MVSYNNNDCNYGNKSAWGIAIELDCVYLELINSCRPFAFSISKASSASFKREPSSWLPFQICYW